MHSLPSSRSLIKMLNKSGPNTEPWEHHWGLATEEIELNSLKSRQTTAAALSTKLPAPSARVYKLSFFLFPEAARVSARLISPASSPFGALGPPAAAPFKILFLKKVQALQFKTTTSQGALSTRSLNRPKSAFWKSKVAVQLTTFLTSPRIKNSTIS